MDKYAGIKLMLVLIKTQNLGNLFLKVRDHKHKKQAHNKPAA